MIKRVLLICLFVVSILNGKEDAKFLVIDSNVYEKIEMLNILNGGIKKEYIVSSTRLSNDSLKKYYPEYFIYNAPVCFNINEIYVDKNENEKFDFLKAKEDILKEVKKVKLLQMLSESENQEIALSFMSSRIIKSIGILCSNNIYLRGKLYSVNSNISDYKIKSINMKNATVNLEKR